MKLMNDYCEIVSNFQWKDNTTGWKPAKFTDGLEVLLKNVECWEIYG